MSAVIQSSTGATVDGFTSITTDTPSGLISGNLLFTLPVWGSGQGGWNGIDWATPGFTEIETRQHADSGFLGGAIGRRTADGTEGATIVLPMAVGGNNDEASNIFLRIDGHTGTPDATSAEGNSSSLVFPSHTPAAGSNEYLWLACGVVDSGVAVSTDPTNYTEDGSSPQIETGQTTAYLAWRLLTASSEQPGAVTLASSTRWIGFTVAIQSAVGGGPSGPPVGTLQMMGYGI